jgi:beta-lactamase regulating signal transducer with metallopeptidase domain
MPAAMIHASMNFLTAVAGAALRSMALGCFVAAALAAFRVKNVRMKIIAWRGTLIAALAMPFLSLLSPAVRVALPFPSLPTSSASAVIPAGHTTAAYVAEPKSVAKSVSRAHDRTLDRTQIPARVGPVEYSRHAEQPVNPAASRREIPWPFVALLAYSAIVLIFSVRVIVGARLGRRLVRGATPVQDAGATQMLSAASRDASLRAVPRLAESEMISVPVMLGISKPTILLPGEWRDWEESELAAVLAHEVSHVERHDALTQRLALIHRAIFWFSPLAWWLERRLADLSEQASDEAALGGGVDRVRYAETLLGFFAALEAGPERVWWQGVSMAKPGQAEKRVDRILAWRGAMSNKLGKSVVLALFVVAVPIVALTAAVHPATYDVQLSPAPAAPQTPAAPQAAPSPAPNQPRPPASASDSAPAQAPAPPDAEQAPAHDEIWITVPALNLPQVTVPPIHIQVPPGPPTPPMTFSTSGDWNFFKEFDGGYYVGRYGDWGPRFVIVTRDSDAVTMSGDREDAEHAKSLRSKIPGEFIWFEHDGKSYIIQDQATVDRAKKMWAAEDDAAKQEEALRKKEKDLGKQMRDEVQQKLDGIRIQIPDLSAQLEKLQSDAKKLSASGASLQQLGDLQREIGELQRIIGQTDWEAGIRPAEIGRQAGELGRQMGELGWQIGETARQAAERAREASREMKELLDDATAHGLAKPE